MAKFDIETFLTKFEAKMKTNLAAAITAVNLEKNPGMNDMPTPVIADFLIPQIEEGAWIFQSLDVKAKNYENFVFYFIDGVTTQFRGQALAREYTVEVDMFIIDKGDDYVYKAVLRYWRALEQAITDAWRSVDAAAEIDFESLGPVTVQLQNSSYYHKVIGASLKVNITT